MKLVRPGLFTTLRDVRNPAMFAAAWGLMQHRTSIVFLIPLSAGGVQRAEPPFFFPCGVPLILK